MNKNWRIFAVAFVCFYLLVGLDLLREYVTNDMQGLKTTIAVGQWAAVGVIGVYLLHLVYQTLTESRQKQVRRFVPFA